MARIPLRERRRLKLEAHMTAAGVVVMEEEVVEVIEKPKPKKASKSKAKSKGKKKKGE